MLNTELGKNYFWLSKTSNICFHMPKQGMTPETSQINPMLMCRLDFRLFSGPGIVVYHVNKNILTRQERYKSCPHGQRTTHLFLIASNFSGSSTTTLTPRCILAFWRLKSRQAILAFSTRLGMAENKKIPTHYNSKISTKFFKLQLPNPRSNLHLCKGIQGYNTYR